MKILKIYILPIGTIILLAFFLLDIKSITSYKRPVSNNNKIESQVNTDIKIIDSIKDFSAVKMNSPVETTFRIINIGKTPLSIYKINTGCSCTVPDWSKKPVLPGDTTVIKVMYDSSILGYFVKKIFVLSNAKNSPTLLVIRGEIVL